MTLKVRNLRCQRRLFIILVSLKMAWFSEKMLISTRCIHGFMSNLIKKSWTDSTIHLKSAQGNDLVPSFGDLSRSEEFSEIKVPSFVFLFFFIGRQKQFFSWRFFFFIYNLHASDEDFQKILHFTVNKTGQQTCTRLDFVISYFLF